jgi:hypothetical protein
MGEIVSEKALQLDRALQDISKFFTNEDRQILQAFIRSDLHLQDCP